MKGGQSKGWVEHEERLENGKMSGEYRRKRKREVVVVVMLELDSLY